MNNPDLDYMHKSDHMDNVILDDNDNDDDEEDSLMSSTLNDLSILEDPSIGDDDHDDDDHDADDSGAPPQPPNFSGMVLRRVRSRDASANAAIATATAGTANSNKDASAVTAEDESVVSSLSGDAKSGSRRLFVSSDDDDDENHLNVNLDDLEAKALKLAGVGVDDVNDVNDDKNDTGKPPRIPRPPVVPVFRLGAPQVLDDEDSDCELDEEQRPSYPLALQWQTQDDQRPSRPSLASSSGVSRSSNGSVDLEAQTSGEAARRRTSSSRRSRRVSQAWQGELMLFEGSDDGNPLKDNEDDARRKERNLSLHGFQGMRPRPSVLFSGYDSGEIYTAAPEAPPTPEHKVSKILMRMKQGIQQTPQANLLSDYHNSAPSQASGPKHNYTPEELVLLQHQRMTKTLKIIVAIIAILFVVAITMMAKWIIDQDLG